MFGLAEVDAKFTYGVIMGLLFAGFIISMEAARESSKFRMYIGSIVWIVTVILVTVAIAYLSGKGYM